MLGNLKTDNCGRTVSRNPDSGNMETGIPGRKPPLIGLIKTYKESNECQAQSRFAGISRLYICEISCILRNCQSVFLSPDCMDTETGIFTLIVTRTASSPRDEMFSLSGRQAYHHQSLKALECSQRIFIESGNSPY